MQIKNNFNGKFNISSIQSNLNDNVSGVLAIFSDHECIYIEKAEDIKGNLFFLLNEYHSIFQQYKATDWIAEEVLGDSTLREEKLILEYDPICNKKLVKNKNSH